MAVGKAVISVPGKTWDSELTSSGGPDEDHADLVGRGRGRRAQRPLLKLLDARLEAIDNVAQALNLVLYKTHLGKFSFLESPSFDCVRKLGVDKASSGGTYLAIS